MIYGVIKQTLEVLQSKTLLNYMLHANGTITLEQLGEVNKELLTDCYFNITGALYNELERRKEKWQ